jgi:MFS superfamily sulfate permease-like transporter
MNLFKFWKSDLQSSLVTFLVALPLCLGIALASNAPLSAGLIAGIVGGIVIGFCSGSSISVSGPAAGLTVIVASAISNIGNFEAFAVAVFISGLIQILFGVIRAGIIGDYFPTSVIKGMLAAIGLILILKQVPHAIGYDADFIGDESFNQIDGENTFTELILAFKWLEWGAVIISFISIGIILFWEKMSLRGMSFFKFFPGALMAVITGILLNEFFKLSFSSLALTNKHLVRLPFEGGVRDFVFNLRFPNWSYLDLLDVYKVALTLAIVGSLESLLSIEAADKMEDSGKVTSKNRELFAQGIGNALSGFLGGLPVTAVIVRTSANFSSGAKSKLSAILHGVWLFLCVIAIPKFLNSIPLSALSAVLLLVGFKLTKPDLYFKMYKKGMNQFIPFIVTILAILFTDLLIGISVGMIVGFIFVLRSNMHKSIVMVSDDKLKLIRFHKDVSFLQKSTLNKMLLEIESGSRVILDGSMGVFVDDDIVELIEDFIKRAKDSDITVELKKSSLALCPLFKD